MYVSPEDSGALAYTLRRLIEDEALRTELAARACDRAGAFSAERMATAYWGLYQDLVRDARRLAQPRAERLHPSLNG